MGLKGHTVVWGFIWGSRGLKFPAVQGLGFAFEVQRRQLRAFLGGQYF